MELYVRMNDEEYEAYHDYKTKCNYEELKQDYDELSHNYDNAQDDINQLIGIIKSYLPEYNLLRRSKYKSGGWSTEWRLEKVGDILNLN